MGIMTGPAIARLSRLSKALDRLHDVPAEVLGRYFDDLDDATEGLENVVSATADKVVGFSDQ